jgi:hypothetical protein
MERTKIPLYTIIVDPDSKELTLTNIDPVQDGAIEREWLFFNKPEKEHVQFLKNKLEYITTAPALVPDRIIFRRHNKTGKLYSVTIDKDNIKNALKSFQRNNNQHRIQLDHTGELIENIYLHEVWIAEAPQMDKSKHLGFKDIAPQTIMVSHDWSANKQAFHDYVLTGRLNGYSIQAYLEHQLIGELELPIQMSNFNSNEELKKDIETFQTLMKLYSK